MRIVYKGEKGSLRGLESDLNRAGGRVGARAAKAIRSGTSRVHRDARAAAPVDSGELRDSIDARIFGDGRRGSVTGVVGAAARHSLFVEFGTSKMAPQPYLGPALAANADAFVAAVERIAEDLL